MKDTVVREFLDKSQTAVPECEGVESAGDFQHLLDYAKWKDSSKVI